MEGHRLAARVSGDSAVAFSWAYCQALERLAGLTVPPRAAWLRALCLELERIANHLGDLGRARERCGLFLRPRPVLPPQGAAAAHDGARPGPALPAGLPSCRAACGSISRAPMADESPRCAGWLKEVALLRNIYDEHSGVRDRFVGAGRVEPALAARLGLIGLAGRASGQAFDLRVDLPWFPYAELAPSSARTAKATWRRASRCASTRLVESCRLVGAHPGRDAARAPPRAGSDRRATGQSASASSRDGAARCSVALEAGAARAHPPLSPARSIVAELAGPRARDQRQHRSGFSADQQVLQPVLQWPRSVTHAEDAHPNRPHRHRDRSQPPPDDALRVARSAAGTHSEGHGAGAHHPPVDAGSCNGCELEIHALNNPIYNLEGLGIRFVASPATRTCCWSPAGRHMEVALRRTYAATPDPKLVVALGDCGCTGGIFGESYASLGRVSNVIPVDVAVPGCPPHRSTSCAAFLPPCGPASLMRAALGRSAARGSRAARSPDGRGRRRRDRRSAPSCAGRPSRRAGPGR